MLLLSQSIKLCLSSLPIPLMTDAFWFPRLYRTGKDFLTLVLGGAGDKKS